VQSCWPPSPVTNIVSPFLLFPSQIDQAHIVFYEGHMLLITARYLSEQLLLDLLRTWCRS